MIGLAIGVGQSFIVVNCVKQFTLTGLSVLFFPFSFFFFFRVFVFLPSFTVYQVLFHAVFHLQSFHLIDLCFMPSFTFYCYIINHCILSVHFISAFYQCILSVHIISALYQCISSVHFISAFYQCILLLHFINTFYQCILAKH